MLSVLSEDEVLSSAEPLSELSSELLSEGAEESAPPELSLLSVLSCSDIEVEPPMSATDDVSEEVCEELQAVSAACRKVQGKQR